ncbi:MAG: helix-turn-helix transcriptional regulator [Qipengyuania citrea]|uniref:helix-turn-helix domain-containing protein n=1 Tax=Alphaproteobacteria TaxID=28211 RepID=UPI003264B392
MFDRALKLVRQYHRLNQVEMAKRLDISPSYLSEIEKGKKTPSFELLEKYASLIGIPVSSLVFLAEELEADNGKVKTAVVDKVLKILEWIADSEQEDGKKGRLYSV